MRRFAASLAITALAGVYCDDDSVANDNYLWDLNSDPYETTNLFYDESQASLVESLTNQLMAVINDESVSVSCDDSDKLDSDSEYEIYDACGGVCSYVDNSDSIEIEQKYFPENAPNIVFLLADDWGYNDVGYQSSYMSWTTPNIDKFVTEGVTMSNYYTHYFCTPSRGALLTGRTANRLGLIARTGTDSQCELPLSEITMAQEMKSAGYKTYMVGKWHLGSTSLARTPEYRGFDSFYGYYTGFIHYYTKINDIEYLDLQNGHSLETDADNLDEYMHTAYIFQSKVESIITEHAANYPTTPMFLFYSLQLIHFPFEVPSVYSDRCGKVDGGTTLDMCGLNLMLDEVVANVTCTLESTGMLDNTIVVMASDNGGNEAINSNSLPFRGHKYDFTRGGVSANAYIFSKLLADSMRGTSYDGLMHVSDWLPTLMTVATNGAWTGSYSGAELDGKNQWDAIMSHGESPRTVIVHYADYGDATTGSIQIGNYKLDYNISLPDYGEDDSIVELSSTEYTACSDPSYSSDVSTLSSVSSRVSTFIQDTIASFPQSALGLSDESAALLLASLMLILAVFTIGYRIFQGKSHHGYEQLHDVDVTVGIDDKDSAEF